MKWTLDQSVEVKRDTSHKVKLFNNQSFYLQTFTCAHKLWAMIYRLRSQIQASEMGFLRRLAALSLGAACSKTLLLRIEREV